MDALNYLLPTAISGAFFAFCWWLSSRKKEPVQLQKIYRAVLPWRVLCVFILPVLVWATVTEKGVLGWLFLGLVLVTLPFSLYYLTLGISVDHESVRTTRLFGTKKIRFAEIVQVKERDWYADFMVEARDGKRITFPVYLRNSSMINSELKKHSTRV